MSSLNIYYQAAGALKEHRNFKRACFYSDFDIICITWSTLTKSVSDEEVIDSKAFDIFRLDYEPNVEKSYHIWGSFIAVRNDLRAYVRREWMAAGVECVWVTVPSQGRRSHLHVACGRFPSVDIIYTFTENLTYLRKSHPHDQFLIAGLFPPCKWEWFQRDPIGTPLTIMEGDQHREIMERLHSSTSHAGLDQFNKIKKNNDHLYNLVFSSVSVSVKPCPRPLVSEIYNWDIALQFYMNIGLPECCGTTGNARKENSDLIEGLKSLFDSIGEKFEQTVEELKAVQEECKRMSEENMRAQIEQREDCKKIFAMIEQRLKTLEDRGLLYWTRTGSMNASTIPSVADGTPSITSTVAALGSDTTPTTIGQNEIADGLATTFITVPIFRETNTTRARKEHQISATTLNRKDDTSNQKRGSTTTSSESTTNVGQENPHNINGSSSHSDTDQSFETNKESVSEPDACSVTKHARRSDDHVGETQDKQNVGGTLS